MTHILQFKISLNDSKPLIWRRIQLSEDATFADLHAAIQDAMGWEDDHLHGFAITTKKNKPPVQIGPPSDTSMLETLPERKEPVKKWLASEGSRCEYTYDYGDGWDHTVLLEKILPAEPDATYPRCIAGERACPPEDCGGIGGYMRLLEIIKQPEHEEYQDTLEWLGEGFDPAAFDPSSVTFATHTSTVDPHWSSDVPIETEEDAFLALDHPPESGIPFAAIKFLREAPTSTALLEHLEYILTNAYNQQLTDLDEFHDSSPLWYAIVAETHLDERLIVPTVRLVTAVDNDWDFLNEQAQHLLCLLAEKYPDQTAQAVMKAIDAALELGLKTPYLFALDVFLVTGHQGYEDWLLKTLANPANPWRPSFANLASDLRLTSAIPVLERLIETAPKRSATKGGWLEEMEVRELQEALEELNGTKPRDDSKPRPEYKQRADWETHYRAFEDRFVGDDDDDDYPPNPFAPQPYIAPPKTGRNDPCPCGSGKKYKKCCALEESPL